MMAWAWRDDNGVDSDDMSFTDEGCETFNGGVVTPLFDAIRSDNPRRLYELVAKLRDKRSRDQLVALPATEFEELLLSLDPTRVHDRVDLLSGLRITPAMMGYGFADHLVDSRGARKVYTEAFETIYAITKARVLSGIPTPPGVFTSLFRLAGAATRPDKGLGIRRLYHLATRGWDGRDVCKFHGAHYTEYLKTVFLTEPLYYCYDESWVRTRPSDMLWHTIRLPHHGVVRLNKLRVGVNRATDHSFGVDSDPDGQYDALHRRISRFRAIRHAVPISRLQSATPDEDLLCAAINASARSGRRMYALMILEVFYGIETQYFKERGELVMRGGFAIDPASPLYPTEKLLAAVGRAFGATADAASAMKLINYISRRYDVPVPREIWSEWIRWVHVHSSVPAVREWQIVQNPGPDGAAQRLPVVVSALEKSEHGFEPGFEDLLIMAKKRIRAVKLDEALGPLRRAKAMYDDKVRGVELAAVTEAAARMQGLELPSHMSGGASYGHLSVEREAMHHMLHTTCKAWLDEVRTKERYRARGRVAAQSMKVMVPDFVAEFWEVLPQRIMYHTSSGQVLIYHDKPRVELQKQLVSSPRIRVGVNARVRGEGASVDDEAAGADDEGPRGGLYGGYWDQEAQPGNRYWQGQGGGVQSDQAWHTDAADEASHQDPDAQDTGPHYDVPGSKDERNGEWIRETHIIHHAANRIVRSPLPRHYPLPDGWQEWAVDAHHAVVIKDDGMAWVDNVRRKYWKRRWRSH